LNPQQKQRWVNLAYEMARRLTLATQTNLADLHLEHGEPTGFSEIR
jgi:hypothetical protein